MEATAEREEEQVNAGDLQQSTSYRFRQKDIVSFAYLNSFNVKKIKMFKKYAKKIKICLF